MTDDLRTDLTELRSRLDALERGDFTPYAQRLVEEFEQLKLNVRTLMDERTGAQALFLRRTRTFVWVGVIGGAVGTTIAIVNFFRITFGG